MTPDLPVGAGVSMAVLTAASGGEVASWDNAAKYGLFTHHLLDGLYGQADSDGDGSVTAVEAKQHLDRHMTSAARAVPMVVFNGRPWSAKLPRCCRLRRPGGFHQRPVLEIPAELNRSFTVETTPSHARVQILERAALRTWHAFAARQISVGSDRRRVPAREAAGFARRAGLDQPACGAEACHGR